MVTEFVGDNGILGGYFFVMIEFGDKMSIFFEVFGIFIVWVMTGDTLVFIWEFFQGIELILAISRSITLRKLSACHLKPFKVEFHVVISLVNIVEQFGLDLVVLSLSWEFVDFGLELLGFGLDYKKMYAEWGDGAFVYFF